MVLSLNRIQESQSSVFPCALCGESWFFPASAFRCRIQTPQKEICIDNLSRLAFTADVFVNSHLRVELRAFEQEALYGARIHLVDRRGAHRRLGGRQDHEGGWLRCVCRHHPRDRGRHCRRMDRKPPRLWSGWHDLEHSRRDPWGGDSDLDHPTHQKGSLNQKSEHADERRTRLVSELQTEVGQCLV